MPWVSSSEPKVDAQFRTPALGAMPTALSGHVFNPMLNPPKANHPVRRRLCPRPTRLVDGGGGDLAGTCGHRLKLYNETVGGFSGPTNR